MKHYKIEIIRTRRTEEWKEVKYEVRSQKQIRLLWSPKILTVGELPIWCQACVGKSEREDMISIMDDRRSMIE